MSFAKGIKTIATDSHFLVPLFVLLAGIVSAGGIALNEKALAKSEKNEERCMASAVQQVEKNRIVAARSGRNLRFDRGGVAGSG